MKKLKYILRFENPVIYVFLIVSFTLSYFNYYLIGLLLLIIYLGRKSINYLYLIIIFSILLLSYNNFSHINKTIDSKVLITKKESIDSYYKYTVLNSNTKYQFNSSISYNTGDVIYIKGDIEKFKNNTSPKGFNPRTYYLSENIKGLIYNYKIDYIKNISIFKIRDIDVPLFNLFKDYKFNENKDISFLFSLSSIHLAILIDIIFKILFYFNVKNEGKSLFISISLFIFYFIGQSILLLRFFLIWLLKYLSLKFKFRLSNLEINSITFIIIILMKPYVIYSFSFIIIYLIVFIRDLIIYNKSIFSNFLITLILLPFLIYWYYEIDIIIILMIPIFLSIIKYLFIPIILIISVLPFLNLLDYVNKGFDILLNFISNYSFKIYLPRFNLSLFVIYFLLILFIFHAEKRKVFIKRSLILIFVLIIGLFITYQGKPNQVTFLDVGQGDGSVIIKDNKVIVVDCFTGVTSYLKSLYVRRVDYLILTHPDLDHFKEAKDILAEFKVVNLVLNGYSDYGLNHAKTIFINEYNLPEINDLEIKFLGPIKNYFDDNDNSVVFKIKVNNLNYLYTGDISTKVELDLINKYNNTLQSDILKVSHHGSSTSSHLNFINVVNPRYAIISSSLRNIYNLPNDNIIYLYKTMGVSLYETRYHGSIIFKESEILTFPP